MNADPSHAPPTPTRRWLVGVATIGACAAILFAFRWLTAADEGEKCGGATACASGLVCISPGIELASNVVENRRCRSTRLVLIPPDALAELRPARSPGGSRPHRSP